MNKRNTILLAIAFVSGFCIMAMEITASRLLSPYYGTSIIVWSSIIGVVMISLSLGYYYGGRLADFVPRLDILLKLIFVAGFLYLAIPIFIKPLSSIVNFNVLGFKSSIVILISSFITTTALFAFPLLLLGAVSPFIIKLYLQEKNNPVGESAGRVSAISTIGSILGTFLPTLVFIPVFGTRTTINIFALILIVIGSFGFKKNKYNLSIMAVLLGVIYFSGQVQISNDKETIYEDESAYQYLSVRQDANNTRFLSINEGLGIQSIYNQDEILTGYYYDYYSVLPYFINTTGSKKILIVGLCGGTIARQLRYFFPSEVEIDGVEIDSKIVDAAKTYFDIDSANVNIYNSDGRMFLKENKKKYDMIIVDSYSQEFYIPWTMTTKEFWGLVRNSMAPNGIMAINVNAAKPYSRLLLAISNTIAGVFPNSYITQVKDGGMNYVLTAANRPLDFNGLADLAKKDELKQLAYAFRDTEEKIYDKNKMVLTDDRAPVEFLTDSMVLDYIRD